MIDCVTGLVLERLALLKRINKIKIVNEVD